MGEAYLMEHIKDQLCFVSQDTRADLHAARQRQSVHRWGLGAAAHGCPHPVCLTCGSGSALGGLGGKEGAEGPDACGEGRCGLGLGAGDGAWDGALKA